MTELELRRRRLATLVFIYVLAILYGAWIGIAYSPVGPELRADLVARTDLLAGILMSLGFMWLCTADAKLLGKPLIQLAKIGIFLGWPVGVPIYLLWARGVRGFVYLLLYGVLLLLAAAISAVGAILYSLYAG